MKNYNHLNAKKKNLKKNVSIIIIILYDFCQRKNFKQEQLIFKLSIDFDSFLIGTGCLVCDSPKKCRSKAYGALNICESCVGFYRRFRGQEENLKCHQEGNFEEDDCRIHCFDRRLCFKCWLLKCYRVGMKKC